MAGEQSRTVAVVLFDGFEILDVSGPVEVLGKAGGHFSIDLVAPSVGPVSSAQGPALMAEHSYADAPVPDIVLVPGGIGTRRLAEDLEFLDWLRNWAGQARSVVSVCTGSGLLAAAGLLDGHRATSNKKAFGWASARGPQVDWVPQARWVEDRDRWTSSGVTAGIDMTLALVASLHGQDFASGIADVIEHDWHRDSTWDPFAAKNGLGPI